MLSHHGDEERGILSYMELTDLKFIPRRMYYITKVPKGEVRGQHGHYEDLQYLFCQKGKIRVSMVSKYKEETIVLDEGDSVFLDRMVWAEQEYMTGDDILLVLCSTSYNPDDYFSDKRVMFK